MKRVSFNVAKALKEAGYPQNFNTYYFDKECNTWEYSFAQKNELDFNMLYAIPTYMEARLWLWREKDLRIYYNAIIGKVEIIGSNIKLSCIPDPEEAIIAAIEYLVENNLIKQY